MANFINYRNINFSIDDKNYYATRVSLSAKASVEAVVLNDGSLLNYAPQGAVIGNLSTEFYLTGSLPSFLRITGTDESSITGNFAGVAITGLYPKSINFSVEPFKPIVINAEFDWYGNVNVHYFKENSQQEIESIQIPDYVANGYKSYMTSADIDTFGYITNFNYSSSCDRPAFFNVNEIVPFRVGKLNKKIDFSLNSNYLGSLISIAGRTATTTITLKDIYGTTLDTFDVSGVLTSQNYEISQGQYLLASANISQTVTENKVLI